MRLREATQKQFETRAHESWQITIHLLPISLFANSLKAFRPHFSCNSHHVVFKETGNNSHWLMF